MMDNKMLQKTMTVISAVIFSLVIVFIAPIAVAAPVGSCVIKVSETAICTQDMNECGNASMCVCPQGYEYNAAIGKCTVEDISLGDGIGVPVESRCAEAPQGICTQDINQCGHASICQCPAGSAYDPLVGQCLRDL